MKINGKGIVLKSIAIGVVVCLLLIGLACISGKEKERQDVYNDAIGQINEGAGGGLFMEGVYITIPYTKIEYVETYVDGKFRSEKSVTHNSETLSPEKLFVESNLNTEIRKVGIYSAPIYTGDLNLDATFYWKPTDDKNVTYDYDNAMVLRFLFKNAQL